MFLPRRAWDLLSASTDQMNNKATPTVLSKKECDNQGVNMTTNTKGKGGGEMAAANEMIVGIVSKKKSPTLTKQDIVVMQRIKA